MNGGGELIHLPESTTVYSESIELPLTFERMSEETKDNIKNNFLDDKINPLDETWVRDFESRNLCTINNIIKTQSRRNINQIHYLDLIEIITFLKDAIAIKRNASEVNVETDDIRPSTMMLGTRDPWRTVVRERQDSQRERMNQDTHEEGGRIYKKSKLTKKRKTKRKRKRPKQTQKKKRKHRQTRRYK